jgi:hypothetical protein
MRRLIAGAVLVTVLLGACGSSEKHDPTAATSPAPAAATEDLVDATADAGAPTSAASGAQPAGRLDPAPQAIADGRPLVIADAGNSILYDAEPAIAASLGTAQFRPHTIGGFGLSVLPELWQGVFGNDVPADDPAAVVVMLGNRDFAAAIADPNAYRANLDHAVRLLSARGARVLWLGLPPLPADPFDTAGRTAVNTLFAELPSRFPGVVRYVPTDAVLGNPDGTWARTVAGSPEPIRKVKPDGTPEQHLCPAGAVRLAQLIRAELSSIVALPEQPAGWDVGEWRVERRYDDPPGGCQA